jgi:probable rRNA maturation factor
MVSFHFEKDIKLKNRKELKTFISEIFKIEQIDFRSVMFIFCSDTYLLKINQRFLKHDYFTDIITFNLTGLNDERIIGEIYISVDTVESNSIINNVQLDYELHRVIFHGILHLCGYKDKTKKEIKEMRAKEDDYLARYFNVPRGTFEKMH